MKAIFSPEHVRVMVALLKVHILHFLTSYHYSNLHQFRVSLVVTRKFRPRNSSLFTTRAYTACRSHLYSEPHSPWLACCLKLLVSALPMRPSTLSSPRSSMLENQYAAGTFSNPLLLLGLFSSGAKTNNTSFEQHFFR